MEKSDDPPKFSFCLIVWFHLFSEAWRSIKQTVCQQHMVVSKFKACFLPFPGVILRDSHGVAQVRFVTGNKILRILKTKGLAPDLPEDLYHLIKKAVAIRKHLERNRKVYKELGPG